VLKVNLIIADETSGEYYVCVGRPGLVSTGDVSYFSLNMTLAIIR
jgi:hypothetical protein